MKAAPSLDLARLTTDPETAGRLGAWVAIPRGRPGSQPAGGQATTGETLFPFLSFFFFFFPLALAVAPRFFARRGEIGEVCPGRRQPDPSTTRGLGPGANPNL